MNDPVKVHDEKGWRWSWNGWLSAAHEMLEVRAWTPIVIGGQLCFCAQDGGKWSVSWGDHVGPLFDDAYDVTDCDGKPLYIARLSSKYFLVWGERRTRDFDHQITYAARDGFPLVVEFHSRKGFDGPPLEADWRAL